MIEVLRSGALNTIQDLGRSAMMRWGVGRGGAMDPLALRVGNLLVGNPPGEAGIEVAIFPFQLRFDAACAFAVTGAARASLDGIGLPPNWAAPAEPGQVLTLEPVAQGVFAYVCFGGGVDAPVVLGGRGTDLKSGLGGIDGKPLARGQTLKLRAPPARSAMPTHGIGLSAAALSEARSTTDPPCLRFIPAAEWDEFPDEAAERFVSNPWTVGRQVNRQGYRLEGLELRRAGGRDLLSHGIVPGVIQVPPDGRPIIQMVEANTCGGYPKLGVVIDVDLALLAQRRSGQTVTFRGVGWEEAMAARRGLERQLRGIETALRLMSGRNGSPPRTA